MKHVSFAVSFWFWVVLQLRILRRSPLRRVIPQTAPPPPPTATSVEEFDTTTVEQRASASEEKSGGRFLGTTVASLGDPTKPGFWIMTPLATGEGPGRAEFPAEGTSVSVTLIPTEGSSRASLAALRVLGAPLGDLAELKIYAE